MKIDGVYDLECSGWDKYLVGALKGADGERFLSWDEDTFFDALIVKTGRWYAHNGGKYDGLWFIDQCVKRGIPFQAMMRGASALCIKVGKLELRDSLAIIPMALDKAAGLSGKYKKAALGLPCECGDNCGGYCAFSRPLSRSEKSKTEDYLWADIDTLMDVLEALGTVAEREDISLTLTVGGSAWKTAQKWSSLPACKHDLKRYQEIREGYYGGRTECYRTHAEVGYRFDIHSSYPAALSIVRLPIGEPVLCGYSAARKAYAAGKDGIYSARLTVPEMNCPPLPMRTDERLIYPYGEIKGTWTGLQLRYAESVGARIENISRAYAWEETAPMLADYANRVWRLRANAAATCKTGAEKCKCYGCTLAAWYKWLANSLTGKTAQRPEHSTLHWAPGEAPEIPDDADIVATRDGRHPGVFFTVKRVSIDACAHVEWAATLTAHATCELHRQLSGTPRPMYCDTDSVYAMDMVHRRVGPELGEWGYEGEALKWQCPAPKVYKYFNPATGKWVVRGKGMPGLDVAGFDGLLRGDRWNVNRGVESLKTQIRDNEATALFSKKSLSRALWLVPGWCGGRETSNDGVTRPTTAERYTEAHAMRAKVRSQAASNGRVRARTRALARV